MAHYLITLIFILYFTYTTNEKLSLCVTYFKCYALHTDKVSSRVEYRMCSTKLLLIMILTTGVLVCSSIYFLLFKECVDVDSLNSEICVCASWSCPIHTSLVGLCVNSTNTLGIFFEVLLFSSGVVREWK